MSAPPPRLGWFECDRPEGPRQMAYAEWGDSDNPHVVFCVHGLTRNGRDFDVLAEALSRHCRVICPDVLGRGRSDWLTDPQGYTNLLYAGDLNAFVSQVMASAPNGVTTVDWVGTSMGGIVGMLLAAIDGTPLRRLVLNDVGAMIPWKSLERIGTYLGQDPSFSSVEEVATVLSVVHASFGPLSGDQWRHMAEHGHRRKPDGSLGLAYDPAIKVVFNAAFEDLKGADVGLWAVWDKIAAPVLLVRGAHSDLLLRATAEEMLIRGPRCVLFELPDAGHAPALMADDQVSCVVDFLTT